MPSRTSTFASRPGFLVDQHSIRRNSGRQINWGLVGEKYRETPGQIVRMAAAASADSATITVDALEQALPAGTLIYFGELGETVRTTALEPVGETTIAVEADHTAIEDNDEGTVYGVGYKTLRAGTVMDEIDSTGLVVPRAAGADVSGRTTIGLLASDAHEDRTGGSVESLSGYGIITGGVVYSNLLPDGVPDANALTALGALPGGGFAFETYADDRPT